MWLNRPRSWETSGEAIRELIRPSEARKLALRSGCPRDEVEGLDPERGRSHTLRLERGKVWLEALDGSAVGPLAVPEEVGRDLPVGWTISGVVGRGGRRGVFVEVWNVHPA